MDDLSEEFVYQLTNWQNRLFGYLTALLGNLHDAREVLQETNLVLWQKFGEFEPGTNFGAWARKCAYFQALAFLRDRKRDRLLFDSDVIALLAIDEPRTDSEENRELALRDCLSQLSDRQRELVCERYSESGSIAQLATSHGKKESAIKMALMRIRQALHKCIELKLESAR